MQGGREGHGGGGGWVRCSLFVVAEVSLFVLLIVIILLFLTLGPCPQASPLCANLALKHYLLKPVQRIPQYQLLLTGASTQQKHQTHRFMCSVRKSKSACLEQQLGSSGPIQTHCRPLVFKEKLNTLGTSSSASLNCEYNKVFEVQPKSDLVM